MRTGQGQPESAHSAVSAKYTMQPTNEAFRHGTPAEKLAMLRVLLNTTKSTLDDILQPAELRTERIIHNLLLSKMDDFDDVGQSDLKRRLNSVRKELTSIFQDQHLPREKRDRLRSKGKGKE